MAWEPENRSAENIGIAGNNCYTHWPSASGEGDLRDSHFDGVTPSWYVSLGHTCGCEHDSDTLMAAR